MHWEVFADAALLAWTEAEHPSDVVRHAVEAALVDLTDRKDFPEFCNIYPGDGEHYEFVVDGTRVFVEFWVFEDLGALDVVDISTGSFPW